MLIKHEKDALLQEWALNMGWLEPTARLSKTSYEMLFKREFTLQEVFYHESKNLHWLEAWLSHDFLKFFFKRFPPIRAREMPSIEFMAERSLVVSPNVMEKEKDIEAWVFHIQKLVMLPEKDRPDYLFAFLPKSFIDMAEKREHDRAGRTWGWKDTKGEIL